MAAERDSKRGGVFRRLFPGFQVDDVFNPTAEMETLGGYVDDFGAVALSRDRTNLSSSDADYPLKNFPILRQEQYPLLRIMAGDPSISNALRIHVGNALSTDEISGKRFTIESSGKGNDAIVQDLCDTLETRLNALAPTIAYIAALYGTAYVMPYGRPGKGIEYIRSDYYTLPHHFKRFERAGQTVGFTNRYQSAHGRNQVHLLEPWRAVEFRMPNWNIDPSLEPARTDLSRFSVDNADLSTEGVVEATDYGHSLIATAYEPWMDLLEGILSLNMSRRNASKTDRMIGVNVARLAPLKAAEYLNMVAAQVKRDAKASAQNSLRRGFVQTVWNSLIPIFGDPKGRLDISTIEGNPNIADIEDVMFSVRRLGGALGIDPSLLGFGETLSGGLGDGGFFRMSVMAALVSTNLRQGIRQGIEQLCEIHVALKYGKVFLPGEKPWTINFNSLSTALEREAAENRDSRLGYATGIAQLMELIDPEGTRGKEYPNWLFTEILRLDGDKTTTFLSKIRRSPGDGNDNGGLQPPGNSMFESASEIAMPPHIEAKLREFVYDVMIEASRRQAA